MLCLRKTEAYKHEREGEAWFLSMFMRLQFIGTKLKCIRKIGINMGSINPIGIGYK